MSWLQRALWTGVFAVATSVMAWADEGEKTGSATEKAPASDHANKKADPAAKLAEKASASDHANKKADPAAKLAEKASASDHASKKADPAAKLAEKVQAGEIANWIKQLDADNFVDRQEASKKLYEAGKDVIPALSEAAGGESLEVTVRAIDLLQRFLESSDQPVQDAAKDALEKIAKSSKTGAAERAKQVLHPEAEPQPQGPLGALNIVGGGNLLGVSKQVSVSNINGVTTIDVSDGDRKIHITKKADDSIKMEITEKVNGKDETKKYEAKNAEELKKKFPKAYEAYQENTKDDQAMGGMLQLHLGGIAPPGAIPAMPAMPAMPGMQLGKLVPAPAIGPVGAPHDGDDLGESLKSWNRLLKSMQGELEPDQITPEEKKKMKAQIAEMKKQLHELEKRLEKPAEKPKK